MSTGNQAVRASQFIFSFGPGSVLETPSGPVVIRSMENLMTALSKPPSDFEISEQRLSLGALNGARITRVPTNDELGIPSGTFIYPTAPFPMWALCTRHSGYQVLYAFGQGCRECGWMKDWERKEKAGREAIRFVRSCVAGHLDDVDWTVAVHRDSRCKSDQFRWEGAGRSLRQSWLICSKCKTRVNFGQIYARPQRCSGRRPETIGLHEDCIHDAKIIQRGASNLHVPEHQTALTIGDMPLWLHNALSDATVRTRIEMLLEDEALSEESFRRRIIDNEKVPLTASIQQQLRVTPWDQIKSAVNDLLGITGGQKDLRQEELEFLQRAAEVGVPPLPPLVPGNPPLIEVHRSDVHTLGPESSRLGLRVTPVSRLRVVIAQTGYRRLGGEPSTVSFNHGISTWYPGVELFGEGIFLDIPNRPLGLSGERVNAWRTVTDERCPTDPVFVWWHTLAHRLLRALSVDSGYSSAAIRERVYVRRRMDGETDGGLLLYTAQPGGDGTLGGLIEMAKRFSDVLASAVEDLDACSNDPLCEESPLHNAIGAVCYSCLLASETSCEWQNKGLDRILLRDNRP